jgi:hypothetical protein
MNRFSQFASRLAPPQSLSFAFGLPALVGVFLLLTHGMIPFSNDGHCDPWHYFGYFYLDDQFSMMGDSRTYSRLPMTILGFVLTRLFRSILADYVQFILWIALVAGSVLCVAERLFGRLAATVASLFVATSGIVVGVLSVNYTGPALAWSALAIATALLAGASSTGSRRRTLLAIAGFLWGTALIGHFYSITYNFVVPLYALSWRNSRPVSLLAELLITTLQLLLGILVAVVVFGLISKFLLGAEFTFFRHQYVEVFTVTAEGYRRAVTLFYKPNWYLLGGKAALLGLGLSLSLWQLATIRLAPMSDRPKIVRVNLPLAVMTVAMLAYTVAGGVTLQFDYYYVWMLPSLALAIASMLSRVALPAARQRVIGAGYAFLALIGTLAGYETIVSVKPSWPSIAAAVIVGASLASVAVRPRQSTLIAALCSLALLGITIRPERMGVQVWDGSTGGAAMYGRLRQGWEFLARQPFSARPTFWLTANQSIWEAIAYPRGYDYCHIDNALPHFLAPGNDDYDPRAERFVAGKPLVMVVPDEQSVVPAVAGLKAERGLQFTEMARKRIEGHGVSYWLVAGQMQSAVAK